MCAARLRLDHPCLALLLLNGHACKVYLGMHALKNRKLDRYVPCSKPTSSVEVFLPPKQPYVNSQIAFDCPSERKSTVSGIPLTAASFTVSLPSLREPPSIL